MQKDINIKTSLLYYILFAFGYFASGLFLSSISFQSQIMPVWLPAGIGLVGCYYWGRSFLPALFLASFSFNFSVHPLSEFSALFSAHGAELICIASGATIQAWVGSVLLNRYGNPVTQSSSINVFKFIIVIGLMVNLISANIGIASLNAFQASYNSANYWVDVLYWWLGDSLGVLLMAPFLLSLKGLRSLGDEYKRSRWLIISSVLLLTFIMLVLTVLFIQISTASIEKLADKEVKNIENSFYRELNNSISQLHNLASYIQNTSGMDRENFSKFVGELIQGQNTIHAMSWNPLISQDNRTFEELLLADIYGRPIEIRGEPLEASDPIVYVKFISPEEKNAKAIGFNVYSNADRKQSLIQAELSFQPTATPIIKLVQAEDSLPAYLMFFPIFSRDYNRLSESGRKLNGYATGVFQVESMLRNSMQLTEQDLFKYELYQKDNDLAFATNTGSSKLVLANEEKVETLIFNLAGQTWYLNLLPNQSFVVREQTRSYLLLFLLEVVIVTFIMLFILLMNSRQIELNRLVKDRTKSLDLAVQSAEQANQAKSRFLANMSHEIRTPLNAVVGFSALANNSDDLTNIKGFVEKIKLSSEMLLNLVNDILDFSKIESGKLELSKETVNIHQILKRINSIFESDSREKSIDWIMHDEIPEDFYFYGDQLRIEQILMNLCSNALKFTKEGSVTILAKLVRLEAKTAIISVSVKDTGIGIDDLTQQRLFSVFTQADDSTTRNFGGSGLGLAISKELSHLMNGDIMISSKLGEGAEFSFMWDVDLVENSQLDEPEHFGSREKSLDKKELSDLKVLVAEDNKINQLLIQNILAHLGIEPVMAENGQAALDLLEDHTFDLILMDCQMPVMDGYESTKIIRTNPEYKQLPVIALTADADTESREKAFEIGFSDYLTKPIEIDKLIKTLERYL